MTPPIPWLAAGENFPLLKNAWSHHSPAPGLLAAGAVLDVSTLIQAYSQGIFPWFSLGQPILWWSPDPRMVLNTRNFKLHRSLRKTLIRFINDPNCAIRIDSAFKDVIEACAHTSRVGQPGTWIVPEMVRAYTDFHRAGHAHSVEVWVREKLVGGLYCVNLGRMVFGESMFAHQTDASKIAMAALVALCRVHQMPMIDCQQKTQHLASLGAAEIGRADFVSHLARTVDHASPSWSFETVYWKQLLPVGATAPCDAP